MNQLITTILKTNIQGQLSGANIGGGVCMYGPPGIGKTQSMYALGKELDMTVIHISLPEATIESASGIPTFKPAPDMDKYSCTGSTNSETTQWTVPELIAACNKAAQSGNGTILFLDDLHKIPKPVEPYLYSLLGERKLGNYKLDSKVAIMGAMNDSEEAGFEGIEAPIKNRFSLLKINFDFDYWFDNFGNRLNYYVSSLLKTQPSLVLEPESTDLEQFGSPRSWTYLANELDLHDDDFLAKHIQMLGQMKVSREAAQALTKHVAYINAIDFKDIVKSQRMQKISELSEIDKVLWAYIINYIETPEDAGYVIDLINKNTDQASTNFIGFFSAEIYVKYLQKQEGTEITVAQQIIIDKIMKTYDSTTYKLTKKQSELLDDKEFDNREHLLNTISKYIH